MAREFCDEQPCDLLAKMYDLLVPPDRTRRTIQIDVRGKGAGIEKPLFRVTLYYCPFCGTRFDERHGKELLTALDRRRSRR